MNWYIAFSYNGHKCPIGIVQCMYISLYSLLTSSVGAIDGSDSKNFDENHTENTGPLFTENKPSCRYRNPHYKPKTVWQLSQVL